MCVVGERIITEIRRVASENPGQVAASGRYLLAQDEAGCLVGHALLNLRLINGLIEEWNCYRFHTICGRVLCDLSDREIAWIQMVQDYQDGGDGWPASVYRADREVENCVS